MGRKSLIFLVMFILIMGCSTCFGSITSPHYSLSLSNFKNIIAEKGLTLDSSATSQVSAAITNYPLILYDAYSTRTDYEHYLKICTYNNNQLCYIVEISGTSARIRLKFISNNVYANPTVYLFGYNSDGVLKYITTYTGNSSSGTYADYSEYSSSYTQSEFNTFTFQKKILSEKVLFYKNGIYWGTTENDLMYKFDGVFKGNDIYKPNTSSFTLNEEMLRFDYVAFTDLDNSLYNKTNYFYLQEFLPSQAVNLTNSELFLNDDDLEILVNYKLETNFSFLNLKKKMQDGYIYRLYCFSNIQEISGDNFRSSDATSCFFSLNSWKSSAITVINLNDYLDESSDNITQIPDEDTGGSGTVSDINETLDNINTGIIDLNNNLTSVPNLSGESITSSEITDALNFEFAEDPYANFWLELTTRTFWCFN